MSAALFAGYLCRLIFIPTIVGFIASGYLFSLYDGSGKLMDDNDYTFSPGKAMTKLNDKKL